MLEKNENSKIATDAAGSDQSKTAQARFENRRRLLKAIAVATPLMITLRGKPAHAQLSSLGSAGILYGPGAYVQESDIEPNNANGITKSDIGKALKFDKADGKFKVLDDPTRRNQNAVEKGKSIDRKK